MAPKREDPAQALLPFPTGRGGLRVPKAGKRKRGKKGEVKARKGMPHVTRPELSPRFPVHVTVKLLPGLPSLRTKSTYRALLECFKRGNSRFGFRLNHYSVQANHLHLIVEAEDRTALTRGMKGLSVRIAKALNRMWGRKGRVLAERFHEVILRCPAQVRNALAYVLKNARKHRVVHSDVCDPYSSSAAFDGWQDDIVRPSHAEGSPPVIPPATWMQAEGWKKLGLITYWQTPSKPRR